MKTKHTFYVISRSVRVRIRIISDKSVDKIKNILLSITYFIRKWCMRIACSIVKVTNTHSEYVILIAFPLQQQLHKRASLLHHSYTACLDLRTLFSHALRYWIIFCPWQISDYGDLTKLLNKIGGKLLQ